MFSRLPWTKKTMIVFLTGAVLVLAGGAVVAERTTVFDAEQELESITEEHDDVFPAVRDSLHDVVMRGGIEGAFALTRLAFENEHMGIFHCHLLNHLIGHEAVDYYQGDLEKVMEHETDFCELGYRHGAEAQVVLEGVALEGAGYKERLQEFCTVLREQKPQAACYHGAGHAFMNKTLDVEESLALCKSAAEGGPGSAHGCYGGVFAELTNLVGGTDGETGLPYTGGPPLSISGTPMDYCSDLDEEYQEVCAYELNGLGVGLETRPEEVGSFVERCVTGDYSDKLMEACLYSVAAVTSQHILAENEVVYAPEIVFSLGENLRRAYIRGVESEMSQFLTSNRWRDREGFCRSLKQTDDTEYCLNL